MSAVTPPDVEGLKDKGYVVATKSRFLWCRSAFSRILRFFLFNICTFVSQATVNRRWLLPWYNLAPLSIPLTEDGLESVRLDDDEVELGPNRQLTWQKVVEPSSNRTPASYPPRPIIPAVVQYVPLAKKPKPSRYTPATIFWGCMIGLFLLVGAFGITGEGVHQFLLNRVALFH